jgi:branched-chain amino acid transport system substrate-binding protein
METGRADAFTARRLGWRRAFAPAAAGLLIGLALVASSCAPSPLEPAPPTPDMSNGAAQPSTVSPPRYRRSGDQGIGESAGPIVRIGAALSLTGTAKLFGSAQRSGIKLAQDEINANHILGNTRLEVVVEDDGSNRDQASAAFQRFIENSHVLAIMGPTLSDTALSVDPLAQQAGVPVLAISNAAGGITQIGNFIFRDCLSESQLTPQVIKMVRARLKIHRAALLYTDTDPSRAGSNGFKKALQDFGIHIAAELSFTRDQTDFAPQLEEIAASRPDALFVTAPAQSAAPILIQARRYGLGNVPIIGSNAFNSDTVLRSAGDSAEGLIVGSAWSAVNPSARNQQFIQSYRARYGVDPDQLAAQAYTGVYILASAINDAGSTTDPRAVRDALERVNKLDTPLGPFSFNAQHDADYPPTVQIVRTGRLQLF